MRLIDVDDFLIDAVKNERFVIYTDDTFCSERIVKTVYDGLSKALQTAPTVDAVEVVRCKDCIRWGTGYVGETERIKECQWAHYMVGENGYCVYGERKMDAEVEV